MTKVMVRDSQLVVPTCPNCECRLEKDELGYFVHFRKWIWWVRTDAKGCKCSLLNELFTVEQGRVSPVWKGM